ncbi:MAG: protein kinase [Planctomycetes bacterium]|nr:protein kinase [Planctomycetota bacterium]MCC7172544.1 protein kinase [Planctomycetota bacterium]
MSTVDADILCSCGQRFIVADDGKGAPHACPSCRVLNVLPRRSARQLTPQPARGATVARSTAVLGSRTGAYGPSIGPGALLGPYRVEKNIGRGGMGHVFLAVHEDTEQRVALKVLSPELATHSDFVARFHREARLLATLDDDCVARVFFSGAADGVPFFAMEFVEGRNLEEVLRDEGRLTPTRAIELMAATARGLAAAAKRGLIHRDVKPTNLLLDAKGRLKLVDFGLARTVDSESRLTVTGAVIGTPYYLSPEQGLGKPVDVRSDIYSLGATFYHLLCGSVPFEAESPVAIIMRHVNQPPDALTKRSKHVPEPLARIVMRCMAKDPARRYQDYDELLEDLNAARTGKPVVAPPETASIVGSSPSFVVDLEDAARVLRSAGRRRRMFAFAIDFAVAAIVGAVAGRIPVAVSDLPQWLDPAMATLLGTVVYFVLAETFGGRTFGRRMFRMRVARDDGTDPGFMRNLMRAMHAIPLGIAIALLVLEDDASFPLIDRIGLPPRLTILAFYAYAALNAFVTMFADRKRTLHDLYSATGVFHEARVKRKEKRPERPVRTVPPFLALVLSIVPGLGQLANGQLGKGIVFFFGTWVLFPLGIVLWIIAAVDAYRTALDAKRGSELV